MPYSYIDLLVNTTEGDHAAISVFNFKIKGPAWRSSATLNSREIYVGDFIKTDVYWRFGNEHESSF